MLKINKHIPSLTYHLLAHAGLIARCSNIHCFKQLSSRPLQAHLLHSTVKMAVISRMLSTKIKELIELATTGGKLVAAVVQIMDELEKAGLVYRLRIPPKLVLVHRRNRDGMGVGHIDVHLLCDDLQDIGFDPSKPDPICVEITPEDKEFNKLLIEQADGKLGPADQNAIDAAKLASLSASHCNFCLRLIVDEAVHEGCQQDICMGGLLSSALCRSEAPGLYQASQAGLEWRVIRLEAVTEVQRVA